MKGRRGFALVELLVVMQVFIALAAMAIPALWKSRESARRAACLSNLRQLILGIKNYTQDYDEYYPTSAKPDKEINVETHYKDLGILYPDYVSSVDVFTCPSSGDKMPRTRMTDADDSKPFRDQEARQVSYAYGYDGCEGKKRPWTEAAPTETRVLADRHASQPLNEASNHRLDGRNVAFHDGHVKWISGKGKLLTNPDHPDPKISSQSWWSERAGKPDEKEETPPLKPEAGKAEELIIDVRKNGECLIGGVVKPIGEINEMLRQRAQAYTETKIIVRADGETPWRNVADVLRACEKANLFWNVSFAIAESVEEEAETLDVSPTPAQGPFFYVEGQVNRPGRYSFSGEGKMTVYRAVTTAGGFNRIAKKKVVLRTTNDAGKEKIVQVDVSEAIRNPELDPPIKPNDVIYVPEQPF